MNSNATTFSYGLRLLSATVTDVSELARTVAPSTRAWPVLATRDAQGLITLDANGDQLAYSSDGTTWTGYSAPFAFSKGGLLRLRSTGKSGQSIESAVPFDVFLDRRSWKVTSSSFERGEGDPMHVLDGDADTIWHSQYTPTKSLPPHWLTLDMGTPVNVKAVLLTPRNDGSNGRIGDFTLYLSDVPNQFGAPILKGTLPDESGPQTLTLTAPRSGRYLKIVVESERSGQDIASLAELSVIPSAATDPRQPGN